MPSRQRASAEDELSIRGGRRKGDEEEGGRDGRLEPQRASLFRPPLARSFPAAHAQQPPDRAGAAAHDAAQHVRRGGRAVSDASEEGYRSANPPPPPPARLCRSPTPSAPTCRPPFRADAIFRDGTVSHGGGRRAAPRRRRRRGRGQRDARRTPQGRAERAAWSVARAEHSAPNAPLGARCCCGCGSELREQQLTQRGLPRSTCAPARGR